MNGAGFSPLTPNSQGSHLRRRQMAEPASKILTRKAVVPHSDSLLPAK